MKVSSLLHLILLFASDLFLFATHVHILSSFDEGKGFVTREVSYVPGLFKIFDEILGK